MFSKLKTKRVTFNGCLGFVSQFKNKDEKSHNKKQKIPPKAGEQKKAKRKPHVMRCERGPGP